MVASSLEPRTWTITQYGVKQVDGTFFGPAPSKEYCEAVLEEARILSKKNPEYENVQLLTRTITTVRTEWEPVDSVPDPAPEVETAEAKQAQKRRTYKRKKKGGEDAETGS